MRRAEVGGSLGLQQGVTYWTWTVARRRATAQFPPVHRLEVHTYTILHLLLSNAASWAGIPPASWPAKPLAQPVAQTPTSLSSNSKPNCTAMAQQL